MKSCFKCDGPIFLETFVEITIKQSGTKSNSLEEGKILRYSLHSKCFLDGEILPNEVSEFKDKYIVETNIRYK